MGILLAFGSVAIGKWLLSARPAFCVFYSFALVFIYYFVHVALVTMLLYSLSQQSLLIFSNMSFYMLLLCCVIVCSTRDLTDCLYLIPAFSSHLLLLDVISIFVSFFPFLAAASPVWSPRTKTCHAPTRHYVTPAAALFRTLVYRD